MSASRSHEDTLRYDRQDVSRLVWAIVVSLLLHGFGYGVYEGGRKLNLWDRLQMPAWVQKLTQALQKAPKPKTAEQLAADREPPLMFVEVNPAQAVVEAPKNAQYYAAQSTRAANPDADRETDIPKISGAQDKVMRTEDTERSKAQPLQPALPQPAAKPEPDPIQEEVKPKPSLQPGDLTLAKPADIERKTEGDSAEPRPKPRRVAEAKARLGQEQRTSTASQKARQDGGVRERNITTTLDAVGSPFGVYDAAIVAAIQNRWYDLLDQRNYASDQAGKVVLEFRLHYDGRVTDMKVVEHTVDEVLALLCQKAVLDPSPYAKWPPDMRRMMNADYRDVRFTFYYN